MNRNTEISIEAGSTNVYADLDYAEAAEMQRKSALVAEALADAGRDSERTALPRAMRCQVEHRVVLDGDRGWSSTEAWAFRWPVAVRPESAPCDQRRARALRTMPAADTNDSRAIPSRCAASTIPGGVCSSMA